MIAIIPARGGSKRIPHKNIIDFYGKPMIAWTIEAALKSNIFKKVIVSTEDEQIASIANDYGAEVPFLRDKYFDDFSPVSTVTIYTLDKLMINTKENFTTVVQLMPNCPLRNHTHIIESYDNFLRSGENFQLSCFNFGWMNPWWAIKLDINFRPTPLFPEMLTKRSQDLDTVYCPSGAIWIAKIDPLKKSGTFYGDPHIFFPIDWKAAVDIDTPDDLEFAKAVYKVS